MAWSHGGKVGKCDHREYGFAEVDVVKAESKNPLANKLFDGLGDKFQVGIPFDAIWQPQS